MLRFLRKKGITAWRARFPTKFSVSPWKGATWVVMEHLCLGRGGLTRVSLDFSCWKMVELEDRELPSLPAKFPLGLSGVGSGPWGCQHAHGGLVEHTLLKNQRDGTLLRNEQLCSGSFCSASGNCDLGLGPLHSISIAVENSFHFIIGTVQAPHFGSEKSF